MELLSAFLYFFSIEKEFYTTVVTVKRWNLRSNRDLVSFTFKTNNSKIFLLFHDSSENL